MKQHIIYISGLGDRYDPVRKLGLFLWRRPTTKVTHVPMRWLDRHETYEAKLSRIADAVDRYPTHHTVLVGESAGGAIALAAMRRLGAKIGGVVTVCGMNRGAANVRERLYMKNAAFLPAMKEADSVAATLTERERALLWTLYSSADFVVRQRDTLLPGVESYDLKSPGHMVAIMSVLYWRYRLILRHVAH